MSPSRVVQLGVRPQTEQDQRAEQPSIEGSAKRARGSTALPGGLRYLVDKVTARKQAAAARALNDRELQVQLANTTLGGSSTRAVYREAESRQKSTIRGHVSSSTAPSVDSRPRVVVPVLPRASDLAVRAEMVSDALTYIHEQHAAPADHADGASTSGATPEAQAETSHLQLGSRESEEPRASVASPTTPPARRPTLAEAFAASRREQPAATLRPESAATVALRNGSAAKRLLERAARAHPTTSADRLKLHLRGRPRPLSGQRLEAFDGLVRSDVLVFAKAHKLEPRLAAQMLYRAAENGDLDDGIARADKELMLDALGRMADGRPVRRPKMPTSPPDDRFVDERLSPEPLPRDARFPMTVPLLKKYAGEEVGTSYGTKVAFLDSEQRKAYELKMVNGRLIDSSGRPFDTRGATTTFLETEGTAIFAMDAGGRLYAASERVAGQFQHSSFLAGGAIAAAGEIEVHDGVVKFLSGKSGHYRPSAMQLDQFAQFLVAGGQSEFARDQAAW